MADQFDFEQGFYVLDRARILSSTTLEYRRFLKNSGYGDLDTCSRIKVAKGILKIDQSVRNAATRSGVVVQGNDSEYVVYINHPDARKLAESLGYKLLTTGLMYRLFIPYIKELDDQGNSEAQTTLNEMLITKAEWLEDLVIDRTKVKIGIGEKTLPLVKDTDGFFDRQDMNEFGYPTNIENQGEFYYWHPIKDEIAVFRGWDFSLDLGLDSEPSLSDGIIGVRLAKIFV